MLNIIFVAALILVAVKMLIWGIKAAWGIAKVLCTVLLLPLLILGFAWIGLMYIAVPVLIIAGIVALVGGLVTA